MSAIINVVTNFFFAWFPAQYQVVAQSLLAVVAIIVVLRLLALIWDSIPFA